LTESRKFTLKKGEEADKAEVELGEESNCHLFQGRRGAKKMLLVAKYDRHLFRKEKKGRGRKWRRTGVRKD